MPLPFARPREHGPQTACKRLPAPVRCPVSDPAMGRRLTLLLVLALATGCVKPTPTQQAMSLARRHREAEAVVLLRRQLARAPDDVEARSILVRLLAFAGDMPAAEVEVTELA